MKHLRPTPPTPKFYKPTPPMSPTPKFDPRHPRTHIPTLRTPPTLFSRLVFYHYTALKFLHTFIPLQQLT